MESNFKNSNRALNEENPEIPDFLAWEQMEQGIFEKMESLSKPSKPSKKSKAKSTYKALELSTTILVLVILLLSIISLTNFRATMDPGAMDPSPSSSNNLQIQTKADSAVIATNVDVTKASQLEADEIKQQKSMPAAFAPSQGTAGADVQSPINQAKRDNRPAFSPNQEIVVTENERSNQVFTNSDILKNRSLHRIPRSIQNLMPSQLRALSPIAWDSSSSADQGAPMDSTSKQLLASELGRFKPRSGQSNRLMLEGGLAWWNPSYLSKAPKESKYERALISFQLQATFLKPWRKNYFYAAGLQYQQLESVFEYRENLPNYTVVLEDTIIRVENNLVSGQQTPIYGDVEATASAERQVIHYNRNRMLKVFGTFGRTWEYKTIRGDFYLGAAFNTLVNNNGRLLYEEQILNFNGVENAAFSNLYKIDGIVGFRILYPLNNKMSVTSSIQWQKSLLDWGTADNRSYYPSSLGVQMGLSWRVL